ncbi:hypothetical protein C8Q78DRAFT_757287 [Trametes maxima]|nr:hypothetical protein C8Q78DRAFT_757287 [Trametes maxima]
MLVTHAGERFVPYENVCNISCLNFVSTRYAFDDCKVKVSVGQNRHDNSRQSRTIVGQNWDTRKEIR